MCHSGSTWLQALPLVLLGIRSAVKEDLNASPAEMIYGEPLRLPGEFFTGKSLSSDQDPSNYISRLRQIMNDLRPVPASNHSARRCFVYRDLSKCKQVYLRDDSVRRSLQPPYSGPFPVASRGEKTINILVHGKERCVSLDRVKPAYVFENFDSNSIKAQRRVRFRSPVP